MHLRRKFLRAFFNGRNSFHCPSLSLKEEVLIASSHKERERGVLLLFCHLPSSSCANLEAKHIDTGRPHEGEEGETKVAHCSFFVSPDWSRTHKKGRGKILLLMFRSERPRPLFRAAFPSALQEEGSKKEEKRNIPRGCLPTKRGEREGRGKEGRLR